MTTSEELLELTKVEGDLPTDRLSMIIWLKRSCKDSLVQAIEEKDQIGFVVPLPLLKTCCKIDDPYVALTFVVSICKHNDFQVSLLPEIDDAVMVNSWPQSPEGWEGFKVP